MAEATSSRDTLIRKKSTVPPGLSVLPAPATSAMSSFTSRHSHASPSVTLEKGAYRMRVSPMRRSPSKLRRSPATPSAKHVFSHEKQMALLVVVLVLATLSSFGTAYYLFLTRWENPALRAQPPSDSLHSQVVDFKPDALGAEATAAHSRFLAYLPHSGFHNQRIALENALVLARILNRTLLVPPVRVGAAVGYVPYHRLRELVALSGKEWRVHCVEVPEWTPLPPDCLDYFDYTLVSWDWLVNLTSLQSKQVILQRWNMNDVWIRDELGVPDEEIMTLADTSLYHYRFIDLYPQKSLGPRYLESVPIAELCKYPHRLLQLGTLFGSSRLRLRDARHMRIRTDVRQSMAFANPQLHQIAGAIQAHLGGGYLGAHVRLGDGRFASEAGENVRRVWWKLVHGLLGVDVREALALEMLVFQDFNLTPPEILEDVNSVRVAHSFPTFQPGASPRRLRCRGTLHKDPRLAALNKPLFISTDAFDPVSHPLLRLFYETFPCTFTLDDFAAELEPLYQLRSGYDGLPLCDFLVPFLDAMVAGKADTVTGTQGSTFSQFVEDVLWRQYHGLNIVQRG